MGMLVYCPVLRQTMDAMVPALLQTCQAHSVHRPWHRMFHDPIKQHRCYNAVNAASPHQGRTQHLLHCKVSPNA